MTSIRYNICSGHEKVYRIRRDKNPLEEIIKQSLKHSIERFLFHKTLVRNTG